MNNWAKFKAYWEELGSPKLEFRDIAGQGEWEILNQYPHFCELSDYRIAGDRHHELRLKWINSDKVLPIEFREIDCNWYLINTDLADVYWHQSCDYREAPVEEITICDISKDRLNGIDATLAERGSRYGDFAEHARITQSIKRAMQDSRNWSQLSDDKKEALEMVAHKIGRILNGDTEYHDSYHDIIGYTKLVADSLLVNGNDNA